MKIIRFITTGFLAFWLLFQLTTAQAVEPNIFKDRLKQQHVLSKLEENAIHAEFRNKFSNDNFKKQDLNKNPWDTKKAELKKSSVEADALANTWGNCREHAYTQRNQCYAKRNNMYTCERYYDARVRICDSHF
ncbi:MAG: hypothetical protein OQK76_02425 [Gammaproteobacteria bacterium]|nr:hypothetical protein [Gammaproteobacteria bacterium]MCW8909455.1 hypothetical protein [Gammaproteobacteria bacterium]MCW9003867.1 hypothetical protein [Gammaproteobacteria bacterium]MCW9055022.1 hypothetical protein [Gammaproteobacteria bacterium]